MKINGLLYIVLIIITIFVVGVSAQIWDQPTGKQAFGHTHDYTTLAYFPGACPAGQFVTSIDDVLTCGTAAAGADNDWTIVGNNMFSAVSGNVGIGTSSPQEKLDVRGKISVGDSQFWRGVIRRYSSPTSIAGYSNVDRPLQISTNDGAVSQSLILGRTGTIDPFVAFGFSVGNSPRMTILGNGNVGIGTTTPQSKLQVVNGYIQLDLTSGTPPSADCDSASEMGRMKIDDSGGGFLYVCTTTVSGIGWVAK